MSGSSTTKEKQTRKKVITKKIRRISSSNGISAGARNFKLFTSSFAGTGRNNSSTSTDKAPQNLLPSTTASISSTLSTPLTREIMLQHRLLTIEDEKKLGQALHRGKQLHKRIEQLMEERGNTTPSKMSMMLPTDITSTPAYLLETRPVSSAHLSVSHHQQRQELLLGASNYYKANVEQQRHQPHDHQRYLDLSEEEIIHQLELPGGRAQMMDILLEAREARQALITSNVKLVASIAKTWINMSRKKSSTTGQIYGAIGGGWDVPSYDELLQEGILGLIRAVDKFDATRKLRFSTYATYWIQSYIRNCLQVASTTCLRVPTALHVIKVSYCLSYSTTLFVLQLTFWYSFLHVSFLKKTSYVSLINNAEVEGLPRPTIEEAASELGVSPSRLKTALVVTQSLLSIDAPIGLGSSVRKGSSAGSTTEDLGQALLISDSLQCTDSHPEELVELSLLRQCLEKAMASELSPKEQAVLRLLFGLDDGQSRTVRDVVECCGGRVTMAEIRNTERKAYIKLRSPHAMHSHKLISFLDSEAGDMSRQPNNSFTRRRR
jgi:RNA polymerase primary sigma factor